MTPDDGGGAGHVALHVLHRGARLDRDAAAVEHDALADEGQRLRAGRAAVPAQHDDEALLLRTLPDAQQRPHADIRQRLFVENLDLDAERGELLGAPREFMGRQHIGRLVDQRARQQHALGEALGLRQRGPRGLDIGDAEGDLAGAFALRVVLLLLGLVLVELIGAQHGAESELARRRAGVGRGLRRIEQHERVGARADLAHGLTAKRQKIVEGLGVGSLGLFRLRAVAGRRGRPEQQQARGAGKAGGRQNLQRRAALAGEFGVSRRPRDLVGGARQQRLGRRAKGQFGAGEDDERARTRLVLGAGEAAFDVVEGQRLEFNFSGHCDLAGGAAGDRKGARRANRRRAISSSGGAGSIQWRALFRVARDSPSKSRDGRVKVLGFDGRRRTHRKRPLPRVHPRKRDRMDKRRLFAEKGRDLGRPR